jgi:hypothetical protein
MQQGVKVIEPGSKSSQLRRMLFAVAIPQIQIAIKHGSGPIVSLTGDPAVAGTAAMRFPLPCLKSKRESHFDSGACWSLKDDPIKDIRLIKFRRVISKPPSCPASDKSFWSAETIQATEPCHDC